MGRNAGALGERPLPLADTPLSPSRRNSPLGPAIVRKGGDPDSSSSYSAGSPTNATLVDAKWVTTPLARGRRPRNGERLRELLAEECWEEEETRLSEDVEELKITFVTVDSSRGPLASIRRTRLAVPPGGWGATRLERWLQRVQHKMEGTCMAPVSPARLRGVRSVSISVTGEEFLFCPSEVACKDEEPAKSRPSSPLVVQKLKSLAKSFMKSLSLSPSRSSASSRVSRTRRARARARESAPFPGDSPDEHSADES
ncbi:hypothetical protein T484DRAFT_1948765 [Baffinella frigidus]|nr:hypothetical protein T484DRAFT_1948765 [Cryptophyta sp. CCMP2293]